MKTLTPIDLPINSLSFVYNKYLFHVSDDNHIDILCNYGIVRHSDDWNGYNRIIEGDEYLLGRFCEMHNKTVIAFWNTKRSIYCDLMIGCLSNIVSEYNITSEILVSYVSNKGYITASVDYAINDIVDTRPPSSDQLELLKQGIGLHLADVTLKRKIYASRGIDPVSKWVRASQSLGDPYDPKKIGEKNERVWK